MSREKKDRCQSYPAFIRSLFLKLALAISLLFSIPASADTFGQTVTFSGNNVSLQKVFQVIQDQTGFGVFIEHSLLLQMKNVNLTVKDATVQEVLRLCLRSQPLSLTFAIEGTTITIVKKKEEELTAATAQGVPGGKIEGTVYNEAGQPLSGANVTVKETGRGTITNAKGEFVISGVPANGTLVVSFIGYAPQRVKPKDGTKTLVYLAVAKNELDKVVVQAYGTTTQRLNTGNIATVTAAEIERQPVMNPLQALEGRVAGVVVQETNGYASSPIKVEIRGRSGIADLPTDPLYIIDGVPLTVLDLASTNYAGGSPGFAQNDQFSGPAGGQSPLFSMNPADIESITVLKDADATAIYGSRGANGVIIIMTKRGKPGKTKLDLNAYHGASEVTGRYDLLNNRQYLQMRREAFKNDQATYGLIPGFTIPDAGNAYDLLTWDTTRYTDWQKKLWGQIAQTTDVQLSLSGGDKQNTFRIGAGYHNEGSLLEKGNEQRGSLQFNYTNKSLDQRFTLSFTNTFSYAHSNLVGVPGYVLQAPDAPAVLNSQGKLNWNGWQPIPDLLSPYGTFFQPYTAKTSFLNSELSLQYQILKGLIFNTQLGYSSVHGAQVQLTPIISQNPFSNPTGSSTFGNTNNSNVIVEPQLEYKGLFGKGKLALLVGGSMQSVQTDANIGIGNGYINDNLLNSLANAPIKLANNAFAQYKYEAIFARINYNWQDKYLLNLSGRRDGSSRFGPGKQFGNFCAIGAAWIFTEENWFKEHWNFLSLGKLRGSYGVTGSDQIGDYGYLTRWSAAYSLPYQGIPAYTPLQHANPNLEWQSNYKLEAAAELGFFKDNLTLSIAWYRNRCGNQLVNYNLPIITGFGSVVENFPAVVQNTGWEFTLRGKLIDNKDFTLSGNFNVGLNRNKLLAFPNLSQSPYASVYTIGQSLGIRRLLHYTGVDPQTGQYVFQDKNHNNTVDYEYNNGNNDLLNKDLSIKYEGGFGIELRYKQLQLNTFFTFRHWEQPSAMYGSVNPGALGYNQSVQVLNRWKKPGDQAKFARFTTTSLQSDQNLLQSDGVYMDASFLRCRNISLSYRLAESVIKQSVLQQCTVFVRGQNLFVLTKYNGVDPTVSSLGSLPPDKILTGGIQITF